MTLRPDPDDSYAHPADPGSNPNAYDLLERDLVNVCRYFQKHGVRADPARIAGDLWMRYRFGELRRELEVVRA